MDLEEAIKREFPNSQEMPLQTDSSQKTLKKENTVTQKELVAIVNNLPKRFSNCGFKNFNANTEGLTAAVKVCIEFYQDKTEKKSLYLGGMIGNGKTHLAVATLRCLKPIQIEDNWRRASSMFMVSDEFFMTLNDASFEKKSKLTIMRDWLEKYDVFCLDDLGTRNFTEAKLENLYTFINSAYLNEHRIIITSNFSLNELSRLDDRIPSRLTEMAEIIYLTEQDYRAK